ncbi:Tetratricopeptide repeat protein [candidate division SR1 bacterium Aalborg_AAW-1]|nr:Tetratricopeptide repeat protein [candidate division SR1 bacterium Aalborg_AAW-1]
MGFLADSQNDLVNAYIQEGKYDDAIEYINTLLAKDPTNDELLLMIADIQYKKGEINKASKAVDFLNANTDNKDPMGLYVKGVLEMEKNHRKQARDFLLKAMEKLDKDNHEIMRCYALSEYWYGNREKGLYHLERAHDLHRYDAEIIYNMVELYLLEKKYRKAEELIQFFYNNKEDLEIYDKKLAFYESKMKIFSAYITTYNTKKKIS